MKRVLFTIAAVVAVLAVPLLANGANTTSNSLSYEFDNGASWTLQKNTAALNTTYPNPTYSDAGIVVDLGQAQDFTGLTYEGTGSFTANIWLGDGTEAYTPGTHQLSDPVNFSYGPWGARSGLAAKLVSRSTWPRFRSLAPWRSMPGWVSCMTASTTSAAASARSTASRSATAR